MPTNVIMPQMGESITEGTITRWLKREGEFVRRDEPLFEISTDKVDTEIPAAVGGILQKILLPEGAKVPINSVVATIEEAEVEGAGRGVVVTPAKAEVLPPAPPPPPPPRAKPVDFAPTPLPERAANGNVPLPPAPLWGPGKAAPPSRVTLPTEPLWAPGKVAPPRAPAAKTDWSRIRTDRDFDDQVYCVECGTVYVARVALGSGDSVVPDRIHEGKDCRFCQRNRYALVRTRGDLGFLREK